jgi:acyl-CoA reductase-like NAD-dependent aldehyde dehydrogenase
VRRYFWKCGRTDPVGVVLAITPWNDPLLTPARKLAPAFGQAGQRCTATSRVVVPREVADELIAGLAHKARALRLGLAVR